MIDLTQVRIKLDEMTKELINGLKARSNYPLDPRILKSELENSIESIANSTEVLQETPLLTDIEFYRKINEIYFRGLSRQATKSNNTTNNPQTVQLDLANVALLANRITTGQLVAQAKYEQMPNILTLSESEIRKKLINLKREYEVINNAIAYSQQTGLNYPLEVRFLFRDIIEITLDVEIDYLKQIKRVI